MRVVGVDQSYTGFGYCNGLGTAIKKGFPASKHPDPVDRLLDIRDWYTDLLVAEIRVDEVHVFMEGYAFGAKVGREQAGELGGLVKISTVETIGRKPVVVPPNSLKKFVTGKGNAKKNEMLLGVYKQWGQSFSDDNVADAFALRMFGYGYFQHQGMLGDEEPHQNLHKYQVEAIEAVLKGK